MQRRKVKGIYLSDLLLFLGREIIHNVESLKQRTMSGFFFPKQQIARKQERGNKYLSDLFNRLALDHVSDSLAAC